MSSLTLEANLSYISKLPPFNPPPSPSGVLATEALDAAVQYLYNEFHTYNKCSHGCNHDPESYAQFANRLDTCQKLQIFKQLTTIRPGRYPSLPEDVAEAVDTVVLYRRKRFTFAERIKNIAELVEEGIGRDQEDMKILRRLAVWRGDITTLKDVTVIVNAANSAMLGCFNPNHLCIDNAIHTAAGPRLREECKQLIRLQGSPEGTGRVKVTRGYLLPTKYVFHTVGPIIRENQAVTENDRELLKSCYRSCLEALEKLPEKGKSIALCCISTGAFGFPGDIAVEIAVDTVREYFREKKDSEIDKVIFNVFEEKDLVLYTKKINSILSTLDTTLQEPLTPTSFAVTSTTALTPELSTAISWISSASNLLITAGAGLSASDGFDYTSEILFRTNFPGMWERGFTCLYDLIGFNAWDGEADKWGYYFSHLNFGINWPLDYEKSVYAKLLKIATHVQQKNESAEFFVRTSNADGFFARYGFPEKKISTPQGSYALLQCMKTCRSDAIFPSKPFLERALPWLDLETQKFKKGFPETVLPKCNFCGGPVFLCVRGGNWFNDWMFRQGDERYRQFARKALDKGGLVVLELGAGHNTPGVLRWPDEELAERGAKLIRVGMGGSEIVPWKFEGRAIGIEGDAGWVMGEILKGLGLVGNEI